MTIYPLIAVGDNIDDNRVREDFVSLKREARSLCVKNCRSSCESASSLSVRRDRLKL